MEIPDWFLDVIRCPLTGNRLVPADAALLDRVNAAIQRGELTTCIQEPVGECLAAGLVDTEGQYLYAVRDAIPSLIGDEAISLTALPQPTDEQTE